MESTHDNIGPVSCLVKTNGNVLDLRIVGVSISQEIGRIPLALLELLDGTPAEGAFDESDRQRLDPGQDLEIFLGPVGSEELVFSGVVVRQAIEARGRGSFHLRVECRDRAYRMCLDRKVRFHHATVDDPAPEPREKDVVADVTDDKVLDELLDLPEYQLKVENQARLSEGQIGDFRHENLLQYDASDWDFMLMRLEATGRLCTLENGTVFIFEPDLSREESATLEFAANLLEFEAEFDGTVGHTEVETSSWDIDQLAIQHETGRPLSPSGPGEIEVSDLGNTAGLEERILLHGGDLKGNEARHWAKNRANRLALARVRGVGKLRGEHGHRPGNVILLKGLGLHWNGKAMISGVRHEFRSGRWNTHLQIGLEDKTHAERFDVHASPGSSLLPGVPGLLYGTVIGYAKSPGGYELIEVEISAPGKEDAPRTVYARQAAIYAGNKGGAMLRPEPNDEVILGFIQDDPRFPVILGSLYSNKLPAPWELENGKQTKRGIALTGANGEEWQICMDESGNSLTVSGKEQSIVLDEKNKTLSLEDGNQNKLVMDSEGITLESTNGNITLKAGKAIESSVASSSTKVDSNSVAIKGLRIQVNADTIAEIKGSILDLN